MITDEQLTEIADKHHEMWGYQTKSQFIAMCREIIALAQQWQPIETAPKDGTEIILFCTPNEVTHLSPLVINGRWRPTEGFLSPGLWSISHAVGPSFKPMHWMPLPQPPQVAE